jgi:hypothetical protein
MASTPKKSNGFYITLIVLLILLLLAFILSIIALANIRSNGNFSTSTNLQTAYDFGIGTLILTLFALIFLIAALVIFVRNKRMKTGLFIGFLIFVNLIIFGALIVCGIQSQRSRNVAAIFCLTFLIICFILNIVLYFFLGRIQSKSKESAESNETVKPVESKSESKSISKISPETIVESSVSEL